MKLGLLRDFNYQEEERFRKQGESFKCECLSCGHIMTSQKHCRDITCPECGGQMRRAKRPGVGT